MARNNQQRKARTYMMVNHDPNNPYGHKTGKCECDQKMSNRSSYDKLKKHM